MSRLAVGLDLTLAQGFELSGAFTAIAYRASPPELFFLASETDHRTAPARYLEKRYFGR